MAPEANIDNAVAEMKRQLRLLSKGDLIKNVISLYAQVLILTDRNDKLQKLTNPTDNQSEQKEQK